jgi:hypothetical protein
MIAIFVCSLKQQLLLIVLFYHVMHVWHFYTCAQLVGALESLSLGHGFAKT